MQNDRTERRCRRSQCGKVLPKGHPFEYCCSACCQADATERKTSSRGQQRRGSPQPRQSGRRPCPNADKGCTGTVPAHWPPHRVCDDCYENGRRAPQIALAAQHLCDGGCRRRLAQPGMCDECLEEVARTAAAVEEEALEEPEPVDVTGLLEELEAVEFDDAHLVGRSGKPGSRQDRRRRSGKPYRRKGRSLVAESADASTTSVVPSARGKKFEVPKPRTQGSWNSPSLGALAGLSAEDLAAIAKRSVGE
jgi:hypothetical protein